MTQSTPKKAMFCFNPMDPFPMKLTEAAFNEAMQDDAEISAHDLGLHSMAAACSMLVFFGYRPKDIAMISENMATGYLETRGPSGNEAVVQDITTLKESDL